MAQPYIGEIRLFGGSFAPAGWAFCDGSLLAISENETLFQLIGTTYGGDGESTFGLPDLRGRVPVHQGTSAAGTAVIGELGGTETVTLTPQQIPIHNHPFLVSTGPASLPTPIGNAMGESVTIAPYAQDSLTVMLSSQMLSSTGGSQPHENMQPFLCISFIISLFGIFPTQT